MAERKNIVLLGATGSIGESTLQVVRAHADKLRIVGAAANGNADKLAAIAEEFDVPQVALYDAQACEDALRRGLFKGRQVACGLDGLLKLARLPEAQIVQMAIVGVTGLQPTLAALEAGKDIALASKEVLVMGGALVMAAAKTNGCRILPLDSEHNAIFQCLDGAAPKAVERVFLTASGGAFRDWPLEKLAHATPDEALCHPNWDMGAKVTVDSATMANKGLEVIEAQWLFGLEPEQIEVVLHPQSLVHSMVRFVDGSTLAQLCPPSMTFPIQHALLYPERQPSTQRGLDFASGLRLDFEPPDMERYPCLALAFTAMRAAGGAPAVFNAANEVAVEKFLGNQIPYLDISKLIDKTLQKYQPADVNDLEQLLACDAKAREIANGFCHQPE